MDILGVDIRRYRLHPPGWSPGSYNLPMRLEIAKALERATAGGIRDCDSYDVAAHMDHGGLVSPQTAAFVVRYLKKMDCARRIEDTKPMRWLFSPDEQRPSETAGG